ncbi:cyclin-U4-1-like protein [Tanacetum coccineum]
MSREKTKPKTTPGTGNPQAFGESLQNEFRLKREAAQEMYAMTKAKDATIVRLEEMRFTQQQPALSINSFNVHRLLITGVMVAAKFMDDLYYNNAYYAKVGGISTTEMNFLEVDFLFGLGFQLNINPTTFHTYCSYLQREMLLLQPPLDHHHLIPSPTSSSSSSSYKSLSTKLLHYEEEHQPQQEVAAL